ncbi:MAG TPA: SEFIR domain-containing protein [Actinophytocola sp.]|uniref:SEFIR domain-containing protein n=1 Tax=Actinophytocola sp. TaxID=1872138 RepID=UPI002E0205DD|nr:SEFIR domain-containing protein [Actinophytocola sp.]
MFISYAHDNDEHRDRVLTFASFLCAQGIDAALDTWCEDDSQDWYAWVIRELTAADYVLVIASPRYREVGDGSGPQDLHRGVQAEAALLRELIYENRDHWRQRILPVLLDGHGPDEIPLFLQPHSASRYTVRAFTVADAAPLLRVVLRPVHVPQPVARPRSLPPAGTPAGWGAIPVSVKETDTVAWARLPGAVPDAGSRNPVPRQLPVRHRQFVGRQSELDRLATLLGAAASESGTVIITAIAGTAGIGKTALAMHWAHQIKDRFPDGQLHVNLRGFDPQAPTDPSQALHGFLEALGVVPSGIPSDLDARAALYRSIVADRRLLIMLDNAASAAQVRPLLPNTPACLVIVTSRNSLEGLDVREGANRITLRELPDPDARDLLAQRIAPDRIAAEPEATSDLIKLCARLPLALSIVAARAANHPLASLVRQLEDERNRLDALNLGDPDLDIRAVFSWSYRALSPEAARLFRLLGLHPGPDIDHHACGAFMDRPPLTELTTANLLDEYRPNRFRFHDLLRAYAAECADRDESPSEWHSAMRDIIDFYVATATLADFRIMPCRDGEVRAEPVSAGLPVIATVSDAMDWFMGSSNLIGV